VQVGWIIKLVEADEAPQNKAGIMQLAATAMKVRRALCMRCG
jgi:hypothetical protein